MSGIEDFRKEFGADNYDDVLSHAYEHTDLSSSEVPEDEEQKLYFSLLKMVDFQCFEYGHGPLWKEKDNVIEFLKSHKESIKCEPPSYIGMFAGAYNFLIEDEKKR